MICVACGCGVLPGDALNHVKNQHDISVSREHLTLWNQTVIDLNVTTDRIIPSPKDHNPIELLKVHSDAYCCNCCDYAALTISTFSKHWSLNHKSIGFRPNERYHDGHVQTFYSHAPRVFFEVDTPIPNSTSIFDVYMKKEVPHYAPFDVTIPSAIREIPPLLNSTRWHEHLADFLLEKEKRRELFTLAHPTKLAKCALWKLTWNYVGTVANVAKDSSMRVRCLLTEYPRYVDLTSVFLSKILTDFLPSTEQKAEPWKYHLSTDTQRLYAYPLHSLAYSVLQAHKGHPSNYVYPLPLDFSKHIIALEECLRNPVTTDSIPVFHDFIYPLLSAQPSILEENKWSMVMECWLALYAMQVEGNFCDPSQLTGILAKMEYHCRAVTFYQGFLNRKNFPKESLYV